LITTRRPAACSSAHRRYSTSRCSPRAPASIPAPPPVDSPLTTMTWRSLHTRKTVPEVVSACRLRIQSTSCKCYPLSIPRETLFRFSFGIQIYFSHFSC
ncbi:hypothetical protein PENTCL1PPCAC_8433, partial [Pristionchus entomophagus]